MTWFDSLFRDDEAIDYREAHGKARRFLEWADADECKRFLKRIDEEAARPLKIGEQTALVEGAVRANTLREVASWLRHDIEAAQVQAETAERELRNA